VGMNENPLTLQTQFTSASWWLNKVQIIAKPAENVLYFTTNVQENYRNIILEEYSSKCITIQDWFVENLTLAWTTSSHTLDLFSTK
jgi:hypothetical protein